jgi:hypothetical protein
MRGQWFEVRCSPNELIDAKESLNKEGTGAKYQDHREFVVDLFKTKHNVLVIDYRLLRITASKDDLQWIIRGQVGKAITDRQS